MIRNVKQCTIRHVRPAKILIRSRQSSLGIFWIVMDAKFLYADNEDSDQSARMRRQICDFVGCTCQKVHFLMVRLMAQLFKANDVVS